ncbi:MAG TPA: metalloregulator ArsR/SmtB family transcription factor [Acidimicrobiales bacterium]|jgi:ArsR family transcriptional regulator
MSTQTAPSSTTTAEGCCGITVGVPLARDDAARLARGFAALADPVRLRILSLIAAAGECCSCDLQDPIGKSQPTISHHTKTLAEAGLISGEKRGKWTWWRIVPDQLAALRSALE